MQEAFPDSLSAQQTLCGLDDLPQVVYEQVVDHLPTSDILTLRCVNMHNNARVNNKFMSEYVSTRYVYFMDKGVPTHYMRLDDYGLSNLVENLVFQFCWVPPPSEDFRWTATNPNLDSDYSKIVNDPSQVERMSRSNCDWESNIDQKLCEVGTVQHLMIDSHLNLDRADIAIEHELGCPALVAEIVADTLPLHVSVEKTSKAAIHMLAAMARTKFECEELSLLHIGASTFFSDTDLPNEAYIPKSEELQKAMREMHTINLSLYMTTSTNTFSRISVPKNMSRFLSCATNLRYLNLTLLQPPLGRSEGDKFESDKYPFGQKDIPNRPGDVALTIDTFFDQMGTLPNLQSLRIRINSAYVIDSTSLTHFLERQHRLEQVHLGMIMIARTWGKVLDVFKHRITLNALRLQDLSVMTERNATFLLAARRGLYNVSDLPRRSWIRDIKLKGKQNVANILANHIDYLEAV